jgi:hypothetical protein
MTKRTKLVPVRLGLLDSGERPAGEKPALTRLGVSVYCRNEPSQVTTSSIAALGTAKWSAGTVTNLLLGWGGALSKM